MTRRSGTTMACAVASFGLLLAGCNMLPASPPNPFRTTPTVAPSPTPVPTVVVVVPTATPVPFAPYWVKNHRLTEMWSGPLGQSGVISFGTTSQQFCVFRVEQPQVGPRLFVFNPYSAGQLWIDADAIGPVAEEPRRVAGPKPDGQNCADAIYGG